MTNPFDYVNSINSKDYIMTEDADYNWFIVNRAFSMYPDTIFFANEANKLSNLPVDMQYDYLYGTVSKRKRFAKWPKKQKDEDLALIREYYKYSVETARLVLSVLNDDQLAEIRKRIEQGGRK